MLYPKSHAEPCATWLHYMKAYTGWSQHAFLIIQYMTVFVCPCHYQSKALFLRHLVDCLAPFTHTSLTQFLHVSTSTAAPFPVTLDGTLRHQEALKRTDARQAGTAVDHCVTHIGELRLKKTRVNKELPVIWILLSASARDAKKAEANWDITGAAPACRKA